MVAIGFAFNDFDLIVDSFKFSVMDRMVTVVENSIPKTAKGFGELRQLRMIKGSG